MAEETPVNLSKDEIGLLLSWMYRAQAAGPAATHLIKKFHAAKRTLQGLVTQIEPIPQPKEKTKPIKRNFEQDDESSFFS